MGSVLALTTASTAAAEHGVDSIDGVTTRPDIVVDLNALPREHRARFTIGPTELEVWRDCAPGELMNEFFGAGARQALQQRCGISATVTRGGTINVGDPISVTSQSAS